MLTLHGPQKRKKNEKYCGRGAKQVMSPGQVSEKQICMHVIKFQLNRARRRQIKGGESGDAQGLGGKHSGLCGSGGHRV